MVPPVFEPGRCRSERQDDVPPASPRHFPTLGKDAHHGVRHILQDHGAPQDVGASPESLFPESVGNQHHRRGIHFQIPRSDSPPQGGLPSQNLQIVLRHPQAREGLGPIPSGVAHYGGVVCRHEVQGSILVPEIPVVRRGDAEGVPPPGGEVLPDPDDSIRLGIGKGPQEDPVHDAEHGRVGPDPQSHGQEGHGCEAGISQHHPEAESKIGEELGYHGCALSGWALVRRDIQPVRPDGREAKGGGTEDLSGPGGPAHLPEVSHEELPFAGREDHPEEDSNRPGDAGGWLVVGPRSHGASTSGSRSRANRRRSASVERTASNPAGVSR